MNRNVGHKAGVEAGVGTGRARGPLRSSGALAIAGVWLSVAMLGAPSDAGADVRVRFATDLGDFDVWLLENEAPLSVANFLAYIDGGDYVDGVFHRLAKEFVIQGGGFTVSGEGAVTSVATKPPVDNEFGRSNTAGTLAMAKVGGDPDSATSQYFVNLADNGAGTPNDLDNQNGGFTVFACTVDPSLALPKQIEALAVVNLTADLGAAWNQVPVERFEMGVPVAAEDLVQLDIVRVAPGPEKCPACNRKASVPMVAKLVLGEGGALGKAKSKPKLKFKLHGDHWTAQGGGVDLRGTLESVGDSGRKFDLIPDACGMEGLRNWLSAMGQEALGEDFSATTADAIPTLRGKLNRQKTKWKVTAELPVAATLGEDPIAASFKLEGSGAVKKLQ